MCDSEYIDTMFLFLMLYFDGFYHEIDVKFYELILCIMPTFFQNLRRKVIRELPSAMKLLMSGYSWDHLLNLGEDESFSINLDFKKKPT